jgi:very-short-patch-repair endonuclease
MCDAGENKRGRRRTSAAIQIRARQLRYEQTPAEAKLWDFLRDRQLDGYKFRRQHPIGRFIVDFYCPEQKLVVEIDGPVHHEQTDRDEERTQVLQASGYRVYRWTNEQVEENLAEVLNVLQRFLSTNSLETASPLPLRRERG